MNSLLCICPEEKPHLIRKVLKSISLRDLRDAKFDEVAAHISSTGVEDIFETISNSRSVQKRPRDEVLCSAEAD
ncbi:MAG: hypothetical protein ACK5GN_08185 [Pseudomonadota bacterium]|jgi:hypothetical protein